MSKKRTFVFVLLLIISVLIGTIIGSSQKDMDLVFSVLGHKIFGLPLMEGVASNDVAIIWVLRFPRVLLAFLVGGSLAVSGTCIQSVLRNPLASPYTLGVSGGASFGVALVIISGITFPFLGQLTLTTIGFVFGVLTVLFVIGFAGRMDRYLNNHTIILTGMVLSLFINALLTLMLALFQEDMKQIIHWQMGSLALRGWSYVYALIPFFVIGMIGVMLHIKELDALTFGEENAITLGVPVKQVKRRLILYSALLAGSAVAVSGTIGFIGLIAPHVVRKLVGPRHALVIPLSCLFGGVFLIYTDLIARTIIAPGELPVGAITALFGAPFFAFIYFSKGRK